MEGGEMISIIYDEKKGGGGREGSGWISVERWR